MAHRARPDRRGRRYRAASLTAHPQSRPVFGRIGIAPALTNAAAMQQEEDSKPAAACAEFYSAQAAARWARREFQAVLLLIFHSSK